MVLGHCPGDPRIDRKESKPLPLSSTETVCCKDMILIMEKNVGKCFLILYRSPGCQTLSKTWLTSKNIYVQYSLLLMALWMMCVIRWHCWIVEWVRRKANWWGDIQWLVVKSGSILRRISFSNSFAMIGDKLIGR